MSPADRLKVVSAVALESESRLREASTLFDQSVAARDEAAAEVVACQQSYDRTGTDTLAAVLMKVQLKLASAERNLITAAGVKDAATKSAATSRQVVECAAKDVELTRLLAESSLESYKKHAALIIEKMATAVVSLVDAANQLSALRAMSSEALKACHKLGGDHGLLHLDGISDVGLFAAAVRRLTPARFTNLCELRYAFQSDGTGQYQPFRSIPALITQTINAVVAAGKGPDTNTENENKVACGQWPSYRSFTEFARTMAPGVRAVGAGLF